ncbi:MIF4G domain-containing protein isoform X3 [Struthio camelus]|uniref:MIF4G domain-containing protein isoform X3 n=1 Tax=Struthio camelus TaxID=8801 RepID=UPI00360425B1
MGETGKEEYKIQSFDAETQQLLKTALKDPSSVDLEKVANIIVDQSLQDCVFSKEAGRICYTIIQAESKQVGQSLFRRSLLNRLQQEYKDREMLRSRSLQAWICYVTFICNIFDYLRVNNMPMMALVNPVYDCLFRLAQPDSLRKEEEQPAALTAGHLEKQLSRSAAGALQPPEVTAESWSDCASTGRPCIPWTAWSCSCIALASSWRR